MQRLRSLRKRSSPRDDLSVSGYHLRNESNTHLDTTTPTVTFHALQLSNATIFGSLRNYFFLSRHNR